MSSKYKFRNPDGLYFVTFAVVGWIDVFTRAAYRDIFMDSLKYCQKEKGLVIFAYVIMSNHVHLIVRKEGKPKLEEIFRDLKKFTAMQIISQIRKSGRESRRSWMLEQFKRYGSKNSNNTVYQFWQQDNHSIELTSNYLMDQKLDYIHQNLVKAGMVDRPADYLYSSARDYEGIPGLIKIEFME